MRPAKSSRRCSRNCSANTNSSNGWSALRKDFVINVSHELRTPLASIQGYTETLLDGAIHDTANNVKFLTIIRQNAERLGRLVADLMTLSRIELKTTKFQFASYFVNALLENCMNPCGP